MGPGTHVGDPKETTGALIWICSTFGRCSPWRSVSEDLRFLFLSLSVNLPLKKDQFLKQKEKRKETEPKPTQIVAKYTS